jgi:hypothetical protein
LAVDAGLFLDLPYGRSDQRFAQVHGAAWEGPVVVVTAVNDQQRALVVDHDHVRGGNEAVRGGASGAS